MLGTARCLANPLERQGVNFGLDNIHLISLISYELVLIGAFGNLQGIYRPISAQR